MKALILFFVLNLFTLCLFSQSYTTKIDSFYVQTPEYSTSINLDSLHFPCAITTPDSGTNFTVLILVHGTSDLDKDANSTKDYLDSINANYRKAETRMFYEIADSLSRNGIMVLRYDKRSYTLNCIEKPSCWYVDTVSPYDYIKDINNAIDFVKTIDKVDTCNIFLAGHSQGGSFVSSVGYKRNDIRGVLNMAGIAQSIDSVSIYQYEHIDNDPVGANIIRQQFDSLRNNQWPLTNTLYNSHFSPRFWLDWLQHSDSAVFVQKNSNKPTALMYCTKDRFVPSNIHYQIWQDSIFRPNVTFQLFDSLDHSFGSEYDSTMSPIVLDFMVNWIHNNKTTCFPTHINNQYENSNIKFFPNPANNEITITSEDENLIPFQIINLNSKIVLSGTLDGTSSKKVDISGLHKGVYFLKVQNSMIKMIKL